MTDSMREIERLTLGRDRSRGRDTVPVEEPLEIRVLVHGDGGPERHSIAVTMRTPGHDEELAAGFLFTEGIVTRPADIVSVGPGTAPSPLAAGNVINVVLAPGVPFDPATMTRNVYTTSSCGVCGRTSLELARAAVSAEPGGRFRIGLADLAGFARRLREGQTRFEKTGGEHATALFAASGDLLGLREDVGRHNAMDKIVGRLVLDDRVPAPDTVAVVSGRASFELVQKALAAGIPALAAVGAPTSLAVDLAREFGMTLVGFLREKRANVYSGEERIALPA